MNTQALNDLSQFTGTEHYYRLPLHGKLHYTDGVRFLMENADCYWLLDVIASYQPELSKHPDARLSEMQFWTLKVKDGRGVVTCVADSGEPPAVEQVIPYTDFPLPEISIWVAADHTGLVAYLPSEH